MTRRCVRCSKVGAERTCCGEPFVLCREHNDDHQRSVHGAHPQPVNDIDAPRYNVRAIVEADEPIALHKFHDRRFRGELDGVPVVVTLRVIPDGSP